MGNIKQMGTGRTGRGGARNVTRISKEISITSSVVQKAYCENWDYIDYEWFCVYVCVIIHTMYICYEKEILGIDNPSTRKTVSGIIQGYQPIYWLHATSN